MARGWLRCISALGSTGQGRVPRRLERLRSAWKAAFAGSQSAELRATAFFSTFFAFCFLLFVLGAGVFISTPPGGPENRNPENRNGGVFF